VRVARTDGGKIGRVGIEVVGIGGSLDSGSQSERALRAVLRACASRGATTTAFTGLALDMPPYLPGAVVPAAAVAPIEAIRRAGAVVIASPGYHGTVSGLVKNALDYLEVLRDDDRPYLDGRAVGLVAVARGWQAAVSTMTALRQIAHALRGWPTPLGIAVNSAVSRFDAGPACDDPAVTGAVEIMADQLVDFAARRAG
jgi:FMN reductase